MTLVHYAAVAIAQKEPQNEETLQSKTHTSDSIRLAPQDSPSPLDLALLAPLACLLRPPSLEVVAMNMTIATPIILSINNNNHDNDNNNDNNINSIVIGRWRVPDSLGPVSVSL